MWASRTSLASPVLVGLLVVSTVGVAAQDGEAVDPPTPAYVTWERVGDVVTLDEGTIDHDGGELRGLFAQAEVDSSDPRLAGTIYVVMNTNWQETADGFGVLDSRSWRLVNDGGAWTGTTTYVEVAPTSPGMEFAMRRETGMLIGEGGYEGLVYFTTGDYLEGDGNGEGAIFQLSVPPVPDVPRDIRERIVR